MRPTRLTVVSALAALCLMASASGAVAASHPGSAAVSGGVESMSIFRARGGNPVFGSKSSNLVSGGGSIQAAPKVYISWWGSEWNAGFSTGGYTSAQARTYMTDFFTNVGGSPWNGVVTQYCEGIAAGTSDCTGKTKVGNQAGMLAGEWVDDTTVVPSRPKQSDIANAAVRAMNHFGYDPDATYFVFTPSGKSMRGFKTSWCAWHSSTSSSQGSLAYAYMPYIPDAGTNCGMNFINANNDYGNGYFDGFSIVGGHEFSEAETDPFPSLGWTDSSGSENADKCAWSSSSKDIALGSNVYAVQPTWSNSANGGKGACSTGG
jgi:hypothetical protein